MELRVPPPHASVDLVMGDGAVVRVRRHGRRDGVRLVVANGNGFAIDGYWPFWGPLCEGFEVVAFDARNPGAGHLLQIQKPEACRRAMLEFLGQLGIRH
jgi:hypothetical protein